MGRSLRVPRWPWHHRARRGPSAQLGLRHWSSVLRHVLLLHEPGPRADRPAHCQGEGLQEPSVLAAQGTRREGGQPAPPGLGANLTKLTQEQADYIGVKPTGPFKPDTYR